jgi:hypothetical protein
MRGREPHQILFTRPITVRILLGEATVRHQLDFRLGDLALEPRYLRLFRLRWSSPRSSPDAQAPYRRDLWCVCASLVHRRSGSKVNP